MAWGYFRVVVFTTAFIFGLLFSNSGTVSSQSKTRSTQTVRETVKSRCIDKHFSLVEERTDGELPHLTRM